MPPSHSNLPSSVWCHSRCVPNVQEKNILRLRKSDIFTSHPQLLTRELSESGCSLSLVTCIGEEPYMRPAQKHWGRGGELSSPLSADPTPHASDLAILKRLPALAPGKTRFYCLVYLCQDLKGPQSTFVIKSDSPDEQVRWAGTQRSAALRRGTGLRKGRGVICDSQPGPRTEAMGKGKIGSLR